MTTSTRQVTEKIYIAPDGKEFTNEREARRHEWELKALKIYAITSYRRGQHYAYYSKPEDANEDLKRLGHEYGVTVIYVDESLYKHLF